MGIGVVVALVAGVAIAIQVATVGGASRTIHPLVISLSLQLSGLLVGVGWALWFRTWPQLTEIARLWWWLPLGVVGWVIVGALGFSAARLGAGATLALVVAAQVIAGLALDAATGRTALGPMQVAGTSLLVAGAVLVSQR